MLELFLPSLLELPSEEQVEVGSALLGSFLALHVFVLDSISVASSADADATTHVRLRNKILLTLANDNLMFRLPDLDGYYEIDLSILFIILDVVVLFFFYV